MNKLLSALVLFLFSMLIYSSCIVEPTFPATPHIVFKDIQFKKTGRDESANKDIYGFVITVDYEDGDGDLGLDPGDTMKPFNGSNYIVVGEDTVDKVPNPNFFNYFLDMYVLNPTTGEFDKIVFPPPTPSYYQRFPRLNPSLEVKPLTGSLAHTLELSGTSETVLSGRTVRFTLYIQDRALRKSDTITTDTVVVRTF